MSTEVSNDGSVLANGNANGLTTNNESPIINSNPSEGTLEESVVKSLLDLIISRSGTGDKIHVKNAEKVEKLIREMISGGPDALQVITDFDATLSVFNFDGKRCDTSYGIITNSRFTSEDVKAKASELFHKYHPYESNLTIPVEERTQKLGEWYDLKHENYLKSTVKIASSDIPELVKNAHMRLRDGSHEFVKKLNAANVPTVVFSAGSGDSVKEILKQNELALPNVEVIANFMDFDEETGKIVGFKQPTIHPGNKNEAAIHGTHASYFENLSSRHNALVIGDNIGDADMATGMANPNAILKVGFLNYNVEDQLEGFKDGFDVVLVDDQSFHFVDALVDLILQKK